MQWWCWHRLLLRFMGITSEIPTHTKPSRRCTQRRTCSASPSSLIFGGDREGITKCIHCTTIPFIFHHRLESTCWYLQCTTCICRNKASLFRKNIRLRQFPPSAVGKVQGRTYLAGCRLQLAPGAGPPGGSRGGGTKERRFLQLERVAEFLALPQVPALVA